MDTPGLLGRDLEIFPDVFRVLNPSSAEQECRAQLHGDALEILYPTDIIPRNNAEQIQAMDHFLESINRVTGCPYRTISLHEDWRKMAPVDKKELHRYLYNVSALNPDIRFIHGYV